MSINNFKQFQGRVNHNFRQVLTFPVIVSTLLSKYAKDIKICLSTNMNALNAKNLLKW